MEISMDQGIAAACVLEKKWSNDPLFCNLGHFKKKWSIRDPWFESYFCKMIRFFNTDRFLLDDPRFDSNHKWPREILD